VTTDPAAVRLVVVCGVDASAAPFARATAAAAVADGLRAVLLVADDITAEITAEPVGTPWSVLFDDAFDALTGTQAPAGARAGLADARCAAIVSAVDEAVTDRRNDLVVLDAGDHRGALGLLAHVAAVRSVVAAATGPRVATTADGAFDRLVTAATVAARQEALLVDVGTTWRIHLAPQRESADRAVGVLAALAVLGARVDGVALADYPRKGSPGRVRSPAVAARARVAAVGRVRVWRTDAGRPAVPKKASVRRAGPSLPAVRWLAPVEVDGLWQWRIVLGDPARSTVQVGVDADHLVLAVAGVRRWVPLPSVLSRTVAIDVLRDGEGLTVRFRPDARLWPTAPVPAQVPAPHSDAVALP